MFENCVYQFDLILCEKYFILRIFLMLITTDPKKHSTSQNLTTKLNADQA